MIERPVVHPWAEWLRERVLGTEALLGPWLPTLARAVGPAPVWAVRDPGGEPVGWGGLTNRGSYERLLASEWLLADEIPDEFLRRAVSGEHLFFELDRMRAERGRWTVILCDTGPDQLGAPRLVHIALLVALATREGAPERVSVGALRGEQLWEPALARETGMALGGSRTRERPRRADLDRWRTRLAAEPSFPEVWVVGGPRAAELAAGQAHRVQVVEDWRTGALHVEVRRRDGRSDRVVLAPPPRNAGELLRDPFGARPSSPVDPDHVSATIAGDDAVLVRTASRQGDRLWVLRPWLHGSRQEASELARQTSVKDQLIAARTGPLGARSLWATRTGRPSLRLRDGKAHYEFLRPESFAVRADAPIVPLQLVKSVALVTDARGALWSLDLDERVCKTWEVTRGPVWSLPGRPVWWVPGRGQRTWDRGLVPFSTAIPLTSVVNGEALAMEPSAGDRTVRYRDGSWEPVPFQPPVWLAFRAWFPHRQTLVGVHHGELRLHRPSGDRGWASSAAPIPLGPEPVRWADAAPDGSWYAVLTMSRVRFFSPTDGSVLAEWRVQ